MQLVSSTVEGVSVKTHQNRGLAVKEIVRDEWLVNNVSATIWCEIRVCWQRFKGVDDGKEDFISTVRLPPAWIETLGRYLDCVGPACFVVDISEVFTCTLDSTETHAFGSAMALKSPDGNT